MIRTILGDNKISIKQISPLSVSLAYCDCIYGETDFTWAGLVYDTLQENAIFQLQTDLSTVSEWKTYLDKLFGRKPVNLICVEFDWGGRSRKKFPHKTDYVLIYSKGKNYKFYPERVMIPKATAGTNLDKKGTGLKIPTDFWKDMSFSTISTERVKLNGKNIRWQKSLKFMNRLLLPFTDMGDTILDPFLGSGTTAVWSLQNERNFIGMENDPDVYKVALERISRSLK